LPPGKDALRPIIITHPDEDHYFGMSVLHERFPYTPIYMTAAALEQFNRTSSEFLARFRKRAPSETPDSLQTPEVLPTTIFSVDGETVDVIKDFQGDVLKPRPGLCGGYHAKYPYRDRQQSPIA
jgi:glyoxylase-like metal-dependent hydrolase (beta-lactamase superfamily II)